MSAVARVILKERYPYLMMAVDDAGYAAWNDLRTLLENVNTELEEAVKDACCCKGSGRRVTKEEK
jgi:hypothetical protein